MGRLNNAAMGEAPPETLRARLRRALHSRWMLPAAGLVSFLESTVLPVPLEVLVLPVMQKRRDRLWAIAAAITLGSVVGAALGWLIGYGLMQSVGEPLVSGLGQAEAYALARERFNANGFLFVIGISLAPVPFQIAMLAAGAAGYPLWLFLLATLLSRAARYFGLALLVWGLGDRAEALIHRHRHLALVLGGLALSGVVALAVL